LCSHSRIELNERRISELLFFGESYPQIEPEGSCHLEIPLTRLLWREPLDVSQPGAMGHRHPEGDDFLALAANSGQTSAIGASRLRSPRSVSRSAHTTVAPLVGR
jgi:hypothetical protein